MGNLEGGFIYQGLFERQMKEGSRKGESLSMGALSSFMGTMKDM